MKELFGKYNSAKVFTDNIDIATTDQISQLLDMPFMADCLIRIMPDCHAGKGCVVGTTIQIKDKVVPNLVGVDIGCGMLAVKLKDTEIDLVKLDETIRKYVPSGFSIHDQTIKDFNKFSQFICPIDTDYASRSIGTLGGGNHFIEIDRSENTSALWLVIHTGSRHLGVEVCEYYQNLAIENLKGKVKDTITTTIATLSAAGREKEISEHIQKIKESSKGIPNDLCYVSGQDFENYLNDMKLAQEYAKLNRRTIADIILSMMDLKENRDETFDTIHNYINMDDMILRKGSISARNGEKVIIPMNMRDGSLICLGVGNPDWNYSAPHGAGRILSRAAAKELIPMSDFVNSMEGIYSTSVVMETIDEAPMAYKPMEEIISNIGDTVTITDVIKPIYNFKAH